MLNRSIWEKKYRAPEDSEPDDTLRRVSRAIAGEDRFLEEEFFLMMKELKFLPGGRILAYAGTKNPKATLANCYVMGTIKDSMEGIMQALQESALTMKAGGGIGINFSTLRPKGDRVMGTNSYSSGPVSFMEMWNSMSRTISGVNHRKGAMIGILDADHPDIELFISAKKNNTSDNPVLEKFNISVGITDEFMRAVEEDAPWELKFNGKTYRTVKARELFNQIVRNAWAKGEPGVLFLTAINRMNNLYYCEKITACNPCGEQSLPPYGACTLGAVNLVQFVKNPFEVDADIDCAELRRTVAAAVRFLDRTVDVNYYPLPEQKKEAESKRRIGLGIMGLASALAMLGVRYGSSEALGVISKIMQEIRDAAYRESINLAKKFGSFPLFDSKKYLKSEFIKQLPEDIREQIKKYGIRNSHLLTVAPTGSISQLAGYVSGGVEPIFDLEMKRLNPEYDEEITIRDYAYELFLKKGKKGRDVFVTAHQLSPDEHLLVVAECQKYVDSSISKTINLPRDFSLESTKEIYIKAWKLGLKGCTIYRQGSLDVEILRSVSGSHRVKKQDRPYELESRTYKVKIPDSKHAFYITFSHTPDRSPMEMFINTKDPTVEEWTKALGRTISAVFRNVNNPTFIADELKEVHGSSGFFSSQRHTYVPSLIAEFGYVMEDYFRSIGLIEDDVPVSAYEKNGSPEKFAYCRMCGKYAGIFEQGCFRCLACGFDRCG